MAWRKITDVKLAKLISDSEVAFNKGANAGIKEGDQVFLQRKVDITDPDTNERLGTVLVPKLRLNVTLVGPKYCLARPTDRMPTQSGTKLSAADFMRPTKTVTEEFVLESPSTVLVARGDSAIVRRNEDESSGEEDGHSVAK